MNLTVVYESNQSMFQCDIDQHLTRLGKTKEYCEELRETFPHKLIGKPENALTVMTIADEHFGIIPEGMDRTVEVLESYINTRVEYPGMDDCKIFIGLNKE